MEYSRPMVFLSSATRPLIWLAPSNVIFFKGLIRVALFTIFFLGVWFMLLCILGFRLSAWLVSICTVCRLCRTWKRFEVWITGIGFWLCNIFLVKYLQLPGLLNLVAVVFQLLGASLTWGEVRSLHGGWLLIPFRSSCNSCMIFLADWSSVFSDAISLKYSLQ
jgi:hypothetical protein